MRYQCRLRVGEEPLLSRITRQGGECVRGTDEVGEGGTTHGIGTFIGNPFDDVDGISFYQSTLKLS